MPYSLGMNVKTNPLQKAVDITGSQAALARALSVMPPVVNQWLKGKRPIPVQACVLIERVTSGVVSRRDLRPEDYWLVWPDLPAPPSTEAEPVEVAGQGV